MKYELDRDRLRAQFEKNQTEQSAIIKAYEIAIAHIQGKPIPPLECKYVCVCVCICMYVCKSKYVYICVYIYTYSNTHVLSHIPNTTSRYDRQTALYSCKLAASKLNASHTQTT